MQHRQQARAQVVGVDAVVEARVPLLAVERERDAPDLAGALPGRGNISTFGALQLGVAVVVGVGAVAVVEEEALTHRIRVVAVDGLNVRAMCGNGAAALGVQVVGRADRDDERAHRVQERQVQLHLVVLDRTEGLGLVLVELQQTHVLLVHEHLRLGARDVHVVAHELRGRVRQHRQIERRHNCRRRADDTADLQELLELPELDRDAHIVAAGDGTEREVLRHVLREEEAEGDDELLLIRSDDRGHRQGILCGRSGCTIRVAVADRELDHAGEILVHELAPQRATRRWRWGHVRV